MKFSTKDFFRKCDQIPADLVTFAEELLNAKLHIFCTVKAVLSNNYNYKRVVCISQYKAHQYQCKEMVMFIPFIIG